MIGAGMIVVPIILGCLIGAVIKATETIVDMYRYGNIRTMIGTSLLILYIGTAVFLMLFSLWGGA
jgi:hypothetical protein